jgi:TRAP-type C4-dicarboxylate transport system substrate-binding protein
MNNQLVKSIAKGLAITVFSSMVWTAAQAETVLTFGGSDAIGSLLDRGNKKFTKLVNERAKGKVKINFIAGEQLGNDVQVIEQTMQGSVHLYGDVLGWYAKWIKDLNILNWGFTFDDNDHMQKFIDSSEYAKLAEELRKTQGLRVLAVAPTQPRVLFAKTKLSSPDDLAGVKMRVPGIRTYLLLWQTLGTSPARVAWAEVFLGLKTGTIVAAEGPVSAAYAQKFHKAAPNVMLTDHVVSTYQITINDKTFLSLDKGTQKILVDTAKEVTSWARNQAESETQDILDKMVAEGAKVHKVDNSAFAKKALAGVKEMEKDDIWSKGLWQSIRDLK